MKIDLLKQKWSHETIKSWSVPTLRAFCKDQKLTVGGMKPHRKSDYVETVWKFIKANNERLERKEEEEAERKKESIRESWESGLGEIMEAAFRSINELSVRWKKRDEEKKKEMAKAASDGDIGHWAKWNLEGAIQFERNQWFIHSMLISFEETIEKKERSLEQILDWLKTCGNQSLNRVLNANYGKGGTHGLVEMIEASTEEYAAKFCFQIRDAIEADYSNEKKPNKTVRFSVNVHDNIV